uniref:Uncharacterized protein n=1 Tax=Ditylum brightwellii TaxID=49249 RepID=A0A7S4SBI0_9STRA|mmetsp:Transcript_1588/g.2180  ORF Transcript_1588/g.2180 Transcript_1588/m.2180 type:complete len:293 (-) Transcript_1588:42-920(-)
MHHPRNSNVTPKRCVTIITFLSAIVLFCNKYELSSSSSVINNNTTTTANHLRRNLSNNNKSLLYAHLHMAKTAGTELNQQMARSYRRVCGNKGFTAQLSFWFIKRTQMFKRANYDDCSWLSSEEPVRFWDKLAGDSKRPVELHVPCRDPVDHLMSTIKYMGGTFDCDDVASSSSSNNNNMEAQIDKYMEWVKHRFTPRLYRHTNFHIKCFEHNRIDAYVDVMGQHLERRRNKIQKEHFEVPRKHGDECIWRNGELKDYVNRYLLETYAYYNFCDQCMGSDRDILPAVQQTLN